MSIRTDLAIEKDEYLTDRSFGGIKKIKRKTEKTEITEIEIISDEAQKRFNKPKGKYITIELSEFSQDSEILDDRLTSLTREIKKLLPDGEAPVLVAGLGNEEITPDALGPICARSIFSTRHIDSLLATELGFTSLHPVCSLTTGVLGQTGIETGEIIKSVASSIHPKAIIIVDALASAKLNRVGKTVQITNTGITPGSGVGNSRKEISFKTQNVPVIAVGVPTVVDASSLLDGKAEDDEAELMMVTPRDIDKLVHRAARLLALSINCALQPEIEPEILLSSV